MPYIHSYGCELLEQLLDDVDCDDAVELDCVLVDELLELDEVDCDDWLVVDWLELEDELDELTDTLVDVEHSLDHELNDCVLQDRLDLLLNELELAVIDDEEEQTLVVDADCVEVVVDSVCEVVAELADEQDALDVDGLLDDELTPPLEHDTLLELTEAELVDMLCELVDAEEQLGELL